MFSVARPSIALVALATVAAPAAVMASPSQNSGSSTTSTATTSPSAPSPSSGTSTSGAVSGVPHIAVDKPFTIALDSSGKADTAKLPTPSTLFTQKELAQVIPGLTAVTVNDDTQTLTIKGDSSSTIQIVLKRFGKKDAVTAAWKSDKAAHGQRAARVRGLYTFFDGRLGATDAFTDGTNTHVLVTSGDAAGEIWFSGSGFTELASDYDASRSAYVHKVVPALVRLVADKANQGAAAAHPQPKASAPSKTAG